MLSEAPHDTLATKGMVAATMLLYRTQVLRVFKRHFLTILIALLLCLFLLVTYEHQSGQHARDGRLDLTIQFEQAEHAEPAEDIKAPNKGIVNHPITVHLVVAATTSDDTSWTSKLKIPGLQVIHYIADDPLAAHHPPANKGREAMMYHTYFYDYYEKLPDIAILTHAHEVSWHMEPLLSHSLSYAISHLNLLAVEERGYANLRVSWEQACPAHINTTIKGTSDLAFEAHSTREAFLGNFADRLGLMDDAPEILAQPCCSQFAVTRDAIRTVKREEYLHFINWIIKSPMDEVLLGRTWEHLFQWLFTTKAVDCPIEWKTYCKMYNICFGSKREYRKYRKLEMLQEDLIDQYDVGILKVFWNWGFGNGRQELARRIGEISRRMGEARQRALERGHMAATTISTGSLYSDD